MSDNHGVSFASKSNYPPFFCPTLSQEHRSIVVVAKREEFSPLGEEDDVTSTESAGTVGRVEVG